MTLRKHTRRLSRREAAHVLIQAYEHQQRASSGTTNSVVGPLAVSLAADVWEQVVTTLRPLTEEPGLVLT